MCIYSILLSAIVDGWYKGSSNSRLETPCAKYWVLFIHFSSSTYYSLTWGTYLINAWWIEFMAQSVMGGRRQKKKMWEKNWKSIREWKQPCSTQPLYLSRTKEHKIPIPIQFVQICVLGHGLHLRSLDIRSTGKRPRRRETSDLEN